MQIGAIQDSVEHHLGIIKNAKVNQGIYMQTEGINEEYNN